METPFTKFLLFLVLMGTFLLDSAHSWRSAQLVSSLYGKSCSNGTLPEGSKLSNCNQPITGLICSGRAICECAHSEGGTPAIFVPEMNQCLLIPVEEEGFRCKTDVQCGASVYGKFSRCNMDVGSCECYHPKAKAELHKESKICYLRDYSGPSSGSARLLSTPISCLSHQECMASPLGQLSRCNPLELKCECYDSITGGKNEVGYYNGGCVYQRRIGDFCEKDDECKVLNPPSMCKEHPSYLGKERTCQCDSPQCEDGGSGGNKGSVVGVAMGTLLMGIVAGFL